MSPWILYARGPVHVCCYIFYAIPSQYILLCTRTSASLFSEFLANILKNKLISYSSSSENIKNITSYLLTQEIWFVLKQSITLKTS